VLLSHLGPEPQAHGLWQKPPPVTNLALVTLVVDSLIAAYRLQEAIPIWNVFPISRLTNGDGLMISAHFKHSRSRSSSQVRETKLFKINMYGPWSTWILQTSYKSSEPSYLSINSHQVVDWIDWIPVFAGYTRESLVKLGNLLEELFKTYFQAYIGLDPSLSLQARRGTLWSSSRKLSRNGAKHPSYSPEKGSKLDQKHSYRS